MRKARYKVLIVDDIPESTFYIQTMLEDLPFISKQDITILSCPLEAMRHIREEEVDILFVDMDLGLKDINGLKFVGMLSNPPVMLACSAHSDYVFDAVEYGFFRYIGKNPSFQAFQSLMLAVIEEVDIKAEKDRRAIDELCLKDLGQQEVSFRVDEIYYAIINDKILTIYLEGRVLMVKMTLTAFKKMLPMYDFAKPHNSYLVSLGKVHNATDNQVYFVGGREQETLAISQEFRKEFKEELQRYRTMHLTK